MSNKSNGADGADQARSKAIFARAQRALPKALVPSQPAVAATATGSDLMDADGNRLIDLYSGAGVNFIGHRHPKVRAAIDAQLDRMWHAHISTSLYEPYVILAERIQRYVGGAPSKVVFSSTGAESVESAVKLAQFYTGRTDVIALTNSFHGRSWMTTALTGTARYKNGIGPFLSNVHRIPFPYCYRCPIKLNPETCGVACVNLLSLVGEADIPPDRIAAVIVEPVLGEGGAVPAPKAYLQEVRRYCDEHGIVLIADEVQSGFGRTGTKFAMDLADVPADLYVVGKAFSAGFPIAAVVGRAEIMDAMPPGGIGGTFSGNPVMCAAGVAAIDVIEGEDLAQRALAIQSIARQEFTSLADRCALVGDVRCVGGLIGIELVTDRTSRVPAAAQAGRVVATAAKRGVIVGRGGLMRNVVRLLPSATMPEDVLQTGLRVVSEAIEDVAGTNAAST